MKISKRRLEQIWKVYMQNLRLKPIKGNNTDGEKKKHLIATIRGEDVEQS
jgi:hypothetical protein